MDISLRSFANCPLFALTPQAIIEEAGIRWTEVQKEVHEFEKDILKTISKKKGSILATQKVMKYIEDMNRRRVSWQVVRAWRGEYFHGTMTKKRST